MGEVVTAYPEEWEIKRDILKDKNKALKFKRELCKKGFLVKMQKFNDGREDYWEVRGERKRK